MTSPREENDARVIADLNDLLQLDHDAVEAYTIAIAMVRDDRHRQTLVDYRSDHKRHIEEIAALVRERGGLPTELPHPTSPLKLAVQALGGAAGDDALLLAFKAVEGQVRDKYRRFTRNPYPTEVSRVITRAADDEEKHYAWVEKTLEERGVGPGTLPHGLAQLVEGVHKALADPVERVTREVVQRVGEVVGTTQTRGGTPVPSPLDAIGGIAAAAARSAGDAAAGRTDRARPRTGDELGRRG